VAESGWDETIVLDCEHLSGFTGGDPEFECQILDIFADNAPGYLDTLFAEPNDEWKMCAHKLKGAARSIGAWQMARAAERAEKKAQPQAGSIERKKLREMLYARLAELLIFIKAHQSNLRAKSL